MYLPESFAAALAMMLLGMACWGSWGNAYKLMPHRRFELFYVDYVIGIFLTTLAGALTLGSWFGPPTFAQNLASASRPACFYALAAGAVLNCGNILLTAGIAMVGLAIAFPIALGLSIVAGTAMAYLVSPRGDPALLFSGVGLVLVAVVFNSLAYRARGKTSSTASIKHLLVCISSGVLLSGFTPLLAKSFTDRAPLSPYGAGVLFTLGALVSTVPIMSWLFQHPMQGQALTSADYFASSPREHAAGFLGGAVWGLGTVVTFAAANYVGVALAGAIGQANSLVAALWGVFVWKEFRGAPAMSRILLGFMFVLYLAGIAMLAGSHR